MKFDPMTGEPIEETVQEVKPKTVTKYDPMTGEPIQVVVEDEPVQASATVQENPVQNFLQKLKAKPAFVAIIGVVAVVAIVIVAFVSGVFMSDRDRVATAIVNTLNDQGEVGKAFTTLGEVYAKNKEHTTGLTVEYAGVEVSGEYRHTSTDKQLWATLNGAGLSDIEATLTLTDEQVQLNTPLLEDVLVVYNYTEDNDGYITDNLPESQISLINYMLDTVYSLGSEEMQIDEEYIKDLTEWYKGIEVEKEDDKEEFEINGKDKKCTGYTVEITGDMLADLYDIVDDIADDTRGMEHLNALMDVNDFKSYFEDMEDINLTFYLDSNKLAAVFIDWNYIEMEIMFKGGDYRMQNMEVEVSGDTIMEIEGETDGKVETVTLELAGQKFFEYEYDAKSGDFEAEIVDYYGDEVLTFEANIVAKGGAVTFTDGNINVEGTSVDFEFSAKKGAKIQKLSGDEFDLGDASYSDIDDLMEELYDELY